jgi:uroporphyrinogen III methyltransferase/synthase
VTEIPRSSSETSGRGPSADPDQDMPAGSFGAGPAARVVLLGAGPGDAALLTVRGRELLARADVVVVNPGAGVPQLPETPAAQGVVEGAAQGAEVVVAAGPAAQTAQDCARRAAGGALVVRVFPGDPFVGGRGAAEAAQLAAADVPFEVVPGVPLETGIAAFAGVPAGSPFCVATLTGDDSGNDSGIEGVGDGGIDSVGNGYPDPDWAVLATTTAPLLLSLPVSRVGKVAGSLIEHGRPGDTPVSVTLHGTTTSQQTVVAALDTIGTALPPPPDGEPATAVAVVGAPVRAHQSLSWWESRPLFGWTVLVPRTRDQAAEMADRLRGYGAKPLEVPTIAVELPRTPAPMDRAIKGLVSGRYLWIAFTSVNAVKAMRDKLDEFGLDARAFAGIRIAAVGESTAAALRAYGIKPELVPSGQQSSEGLLAEWPRYDHVLDPIDRVLLPRADIATETLAAGLQERGWAVDDVTAYRTVRAAPPPAPIREALKGGGVDAVLFTSSSTVRNLVGIAGKPHERTVLGAIGPRTAETIAEHGLRLDVMAPEASVSALVDALAQFAVGWRAREKAARPSLLRGRRR